MGKLKLNPKGVEALLKSQGVQADLRRRTEAIAAAAGDGMEPVVEVGRNRARGVVITATYEARRRQAKDRALTRAIDSGR